jgi:putative membrane protein
MIETTLYSLSGFLDFVSYFLLAIVLMVVFWLLYTWVTPHDEMALVKENNAAAAVALGGALIGFALPLSGAITHSLTLLDCAIWGVIALVMQVLTFLVLRFALPHLPERIARGEMAAAVLTAGASIAIGLLNAASMTYW